MLPFHWLYKGYLFLVLIIPLTLLYPFFRVYLNKRQYRKVFRLKRRASLFFQKAACFPVKIERKGEWPEGPCILCANHTSYLDIILLFVVEPRPFLFIGKEELLNWPYFKIFFEHMNITVDRTSKRSSHRAFIRASQELDKGWGLAIFPEGGIPDHPPRMAPFKNGAFKLAIRKQVPIVPITFLDNWKRLPEAGNSLYRPGPSRIIVHEPIETDGLVPNDMVNLRDRVHETILAPMVAEYGETAAQATETHDS